MRAWILVCLLLGGLYGDESDELLSGFDDTPSTSSKENNNNRLLPKGLEGRFVQSLNYAYQGEKPHDDLTAFKSLLFLEYNRNLPAGFKLKINANAFYDATYTFRGRSKFNPQELDALESEVELFDAYVEGSLSEKIDLKVGRQVVVWGRSDTIRITDMLNPLDNRRPAMVDIEDLRLPTTMAKFDLYYKQWRFSPIVILEQRFNKNPPFGGAFNPLPHPMPKQHTPHSPSYALDIGGEFSGFDLDLYFASIYAQDELGLPILSHKKRIDMVGLAFNYLQGSWLFKGELAYKKDLIFAQAPQKRYSRSDALLGFEYRGIADMSISYDIATRRLDHATPLAKKESYQHALRLTHDFKNATLHANYLISLFGSKANQGGFERAWVKYDIADALSTNIGVVDYIGGDKLFDQIKKNDMIFVDVSYSF